MSEISEHYGYTPAPIDVDANGGVTIRMVGQARVYMYKGMPGLYLNPKGGLVSDEVALAAGFDVARHRRDAKVQAEIKAATARILAAQKQAVAEINEKYGDDAMPATPLTDELADQLVTGRTKDGKPRQTEHFEIVHQGAGLWQVQTRDDARRVVSPRLVESEAISAMLEAQIEKDTAPAEIDES